MGLNKILRIISLVIIVVIGFQVFNERKARNSVNKTNVAKSDNKTNSKKMKSSTQIGGDFDLISTEYKTITSDSLSDKFKLVYFGFTNCPDICPTDMARISKSLTKIDKDKLANLQPLFITIDPKRDDPLSIKTYLDSFHPSFIGLTGTPEQIANVANNYKVYYKYLILFHWCHYY